MVARCAAAKASWPWQRLVVLYYLPSCFPSNILFPINASKRCAARAASVCYCTLSQGRQNVKNLGEDQLMSWAYSVPSDWNIGSTNLLKYIEDHVLIPSGGPVNVLALLSRVYNMYYTDNRV